MSETRRRLPVPPAVILWIAVAIAAVVALYGAVSAGYLSWQTARDVRDTMAAFVAGYPVLAYAGYVALFVVMALLLFPAQLWIIVFGAILFGFWPALIVSWIASTTSATCVFLAARGALGDRYRRKAGRYLPRIEQSFQRDQLSWMLTMRFIPVVPYFVSNVAPAFLGARLPPFVLAAFIGVLPYTAAYTFAGDRARAMLDREQAPDIASLVGDLAPIMLAVAALPVLALLVRRLRRRRE